MAEPFINFGEPGQYVLNRDYRAATRLHAQHYQWKDALGYNLHPRIPLRDGMRVADVAGGTGVWALDVAQMHPTMQIECMDIDLSQAPHPSWLPDNVALRKWSLFTDPPIDLRGVFDIVHVRLIIAVIPDNDASTAIRHLAALLKPGGWLQWGEVNPFGCRLDVANPGRQGHTPGCDAMLGMYYSRSKLDWVDHLPDTLRAHGFAAVKRYEYEDRPAMVRAVTDLMIMVFEEMAAGTARTKGPQAIGQITSLLDNIAEEARDGVAIRISKLVFVACRQNDSL